MLIENKQKSFELSNGSCLLILRKLRTYHTTETVGRLKEKREILNTIAKRERNLVGSVKEFVYDSY